MHPAASIGYERLIRQPAEEPFYYDLCMNSYDLIKLVLSSFEAERQRDIHKGLELVADDFKVIEMSLGNNGDKLFPAVTADEARKMIGQLYRTPQVAVCEVVDGKIRRTCHYNDPRVSYVEVTQEDIDRALS
jgi:ketosteroid isomerase-like protein